MIKFYHRYLVKPRKNKEKEYQAWWVEEIIATSDISPHNFRKQIKFQELEDENLPPALEYAELDIPVEIWLAPKKKGQKSPR